jgi:hypothetical protein
MKTVEQAMEKELSLFRQQNNKHKQYDVMERRFSQHVVERHLKTAFKAGVEHAQRWISVEEELPTAPYLGRDARGKVELFHVFDRSFIKAADITYWRQIEVR